MCIRDRFSNIALSNWLSLTVRAVIVVPEILHSDCIIVLQIAIFYPLYTFKERFPVNYRRLTTAEFRGVLLNKWVTSH